MKINEKDFQYSSQFMISKTAPIKSQSTKKIWIKSMDLPGKILSHLNQRRYEIIFKIVYNRLRKDPDSI